MVILYFQEKDGDPLLSHRNGTKKISILWGAYYPIIELMKSSFFIKLYTLKLIFKLIFSKKF